MDERIYGMQRIYYSLNCMTESLSIKITPIHLELPATTHFMQAKEPNVGKMHTSISFIPKNILYPWFYLLGRGQMRRRTFIVLQNSSSIPLTSQIIRWSSRPTMRNGIISKTTNGKRCCQDRISLGRKICGGYTFSGGSFPSNGRVGCRSNMTLAYAFTILNFL